MDYPITVCLEQMWYSTSYPETDSFYSVRKEWFERASISLCSRHT